MQCSYDTLIAASMVADAKTAAESADKEQKVAADKLAKKKAEDQI